MLIKFYSQDVSVSESCIENYVPDENNTDSYLVPVFGSANAVLSRCCGI